MIFNITKDINKVNCISHPPHNKKPLFKVVVDSEKLYSDAMDYLIRTKSRIPAMATVHELLKEAGMIAELRMLRRAECRSVCRAWGVEHDVNHADCGLCMDDI